MSNIYRLIIFLPFFMIGCAPNIIEKNKVTQKIESLDMKIFSQNGDKIYSITSPYSTYNNIEHKFQLKKTYINLFKGKEIKYVVESDESTLSDNNKHLKLKGNVKLKTVKQNQDVLEGDILIWKIEENDYLLKGNIRFENDDMILNSTKAKLSKDDIIEFFTPVKYVIKDENDNNKSETKAENAYYNIKTKSLNFGSNDKRVRSIINF